MNSEDRAADPDDPTQPDYDESGVDLSLIRWMLSLTRLSACESRRSSSIASSRRVTSMQNNFEALRSLCAHRVDFILVGDLAAVLNGAPITTYDVDVVG